MRVSITFTPAEVEGRDLTRAAVAAIDCFRASTSMLTALASGAACVLPFLGVDEAFEERRARPGALVAGERGGVRVEGFDLGNSPREFTPAAVGGRDIIMTTTNGTRVLKAAQNAARLFVGAFVNLRATARALSASGIAEIVLACAGTEGRLSMEDALCAGMLAADLSRRGAELADSAAFAAAACRGGWDDLRRLALSGRGAANVRRAGLERDLEDCLARDAFDIAAEVRRSPIRVVKAEAGPHEG